MAEPDRAPGTVLACWHADRAAYIRWHVRFAIAGSVLSVAALVVLGNPNAWVGPVGVVLALAVRGIYLASEELAVRWDLTESRLVGSVGKSVPLRDIAAVRRLGTAVQVVTHGGDKHLLKYLPDPEATRERITRAAGVDPA